MGQQRSTAGRGEREAEGSEV
uniref:Uncharacterized protein n=1 Tax=Arundo donax TaxID=35708 RepID=A0A0A8YP21_ARUDO